MGYVARDGSGDGKAHYMPRVSSLDHVADANSRLSLVGISVGKHVFQDNNSTEYVYHGDAEAVQIIGAGTAAANGYYTKRGTFSGKPYFILLGQATPASFSVDDPYTVVWNARWQINDSGGTRFYQSLDAVSSPWLVTTWTAVTGDTPVPTTAHIASKNALLTCVFVSGAGTTTANGIYTERPALGEPVVGRKVYNLLGQPDSLVDYAIVPGTTPKWIITDGSHTSIYRSTTDVNHPGSAIFLVDAGDSPAPTVVSKTQGGLDAGVRVTGAGTSGANDIYPVAAESNASKFQYTSITSGRVLKWTGSVWSNDGGDPQSTDNTALPFDAIFNDSAIVASDDIASESNWEPLP